MKKSYNLFKPNQYIFNDNNTVSIIITNRKGEEFVTIIDKEDFGKVSQSSLYITCSAKDVNRLEVSLTRNGKKLRLHRFLMNIYNRQIQVDHIDENTFNNVKSNLRLCTNQQNNCNKSLQKNNTTGYKGAVKRPNGKYAAEIRHNGKKIHLGTFSTAIDAHAAYCKKGKELFGEFFNPGY